MFEYTMFAEVIEKGNIMFESIVLLAGVITGVIIVYTFKYRY